MGYLKLWERKIIEFELGNKTPVKDIASRLNRHISTIYNEIKRGTVTLLDTNLKQYEKYCADVGQRRQEEKSHNKGVDLKIGSDYKTAAFIENLIVDKKYSPYAVSVELSRRSGYISFCKTTLYRYIYNNVFLNVTRDSLFYHKHGKKDKSYKKISYRFLGAKTIEQRCFAAHQRDTYGHWELDTVYSGRNTSKSCLLVLTERYTREEIIRLMPDRTSHSVIKALNALERQLTAPVFRTKFKSITCDNGAEFADFNGIEKSCINKGSRTSLYFCHPYSSYERGSNENANKLIRKFIPKGADIGMYSKTFIRDMEDTINNYPRALFGGLSSNEYRAQLGLI